MQQLAILFVLIITGKVAYGYYQDYFYYHTEQYIENDVLTLEAKDGRYLKFNLGEERAGIYYAFLNVNLDGRAVDYGIYKHLGVLTPKQYKEYQALFDGNKNCRSDFLNSNVTTLALFAASPDIGEQLHDLEYNSWGSGPYYIKGRAISLQDGRSHQGYQIMPMRFQGRWEQMMVTDIMKLNNEQASKLANIKGLRF